MFVFSNHSERLIIRLASIIAIVFALISPRTIKLIANKIAERSIVFDVSRDHNVMILVSIIMPYKES